MTFHQITESAQQHRSLIFVILDDIMYEKTKPSFG